MAITQNLGILIPDDGGDFDTWGVKLNAALGNVGGIASGANFDQLVSDNQAAAAAAQAVADAALPVDGSAPMTGRLDEFSASLHHVDLGAAPAGGPLTMDLALGNFFFTGPPTGLLDPISFANTPAVAAASIIAFLSIEAGGVNGLIWDPSIQWPGGAAGPAVLSTLGRDLFGFYTLDPTAPTPTWYGSLAQSDVR